MKTVLTIAGFDPSSGAGITADLAVFAAHRLNGTAAITALTVQSTAGVRTVHPVDAAILRHTLDCLADDLPPAGIKIGMLATGPVVATVCDYLESFRSQAHSAAPPFIVLDPVLRSSSGRELIDPEGLAVMRGRLLPLADWVTPNLQELALLAGCPVSGPEDMEAAARQLQKSTSPAPGVLATGGHLDEPDDLLMPLGRAAIWLRGTRVQTRATHGTGCAFSSAFLAALVGGQDPVAAGRSAKAYIEGAMTHAVETGSGPCKMNHLWAILPAKT